jgi:hypothetical protein
LSIKTDGRRTLEFTPNAHSHDIISTRTLFGIRGAGFILGSLGQSVIVVSDPEHYSFCFGINHIFRERANFFGAHSPNTRIVPICRGHLVIRLLCALNDRRPEWPCALKMPPISARIMLAKPNDFCTGPLHQASEMPSIFQ